MRSAEGRSPRLIYDGLRNSFDEVLRCVDAVESGLLDAIIKEYVSGGRPTLYRLYNNYGFRS